ncbi:hypothetical protein FQN49_007680 [Arthroderma sp. PD_2]|nr:hypothetical protein FQN49_007680 [Arthroderma sp. PD_2]
MADISQSSSFLLPILVIIAYALGVASTIWLFPWLKRTAVYIFTRCASDSNDNNDGQKIDVTQDASLYGLDHAVLNIRLPPTTMWMNMGYWKHVNDAQFPEACAALLERVLESAGLRSINMVGDEATLNQSSIQDTQATRKRRVLLDLGIGCGEQTMHLMMNSARSSARFDQYIGVTLDKVQYEFAQKRLNEKIERKQQEVSKSGLSEADRNIRLFCADAAQPSTWSRGLKEAVSTAFLTHDCENDGNNVERYVLGLDTLYHFHPSRREIFKYTHSTLRANLLAFDLFLATPGPSNLQRALNTLFLRLLTPALGAPFKNFVTQDAYKSQLEEAGYLAKNITIEDITDDVFAGLARFLDTRHQEMAGMGLSGFTKWQVAGWLFKWLSSGGILRAGIIIANWEG